jgi:hypothetical protein
VQHVQGGRILGVDLDQHDLRPGREDQDLEARGAMIPC